MKYVALLRGINVGGNSMVKMSELKTAFEKAEYTNVITYINSGNVIFETDKHEIQKITSHIEKILKQTFFSIKVVILSESQLGKVLDEVPDTWRREDDLRCYISFLRDSLKPSEVISQMKLNQTVDSAKIGQHVVYMSTKLSGLTKSGFTKLVGTKVYKEMTMRNYTTVQKIFEQMNKN